jgi:hypothetical protein
LVTIDGVGSLFAVDIDDFSGKFSAAVVENTGRGDTAGDKTYRLEDAGGRWTGSGRVRGGKRPLPKYLASAAGSVKMVQAAAAGRDGDTTPVNYLAFAAVFSEIDLTHVPPDAGGEDVWTVNFVCVKSGPLVQGWDGLDGTAESALSTLPTYAAKEIHAGIVKSIDPNGLATSARQTHDLVGLANTDAGEVTAVTNLLGGTTPVTNLKIVTGSLTRTGGIGGRAVLDWGLQDTKDQQETPHNKRETDGNNIRDYRMLAQVWDSGGSAPATPAAPSGLKIVTYVDQKLNDQKTVRVWVYRRQDSKDDLETPRNVQRTDANELRDYRALAQIWDSGGSAPATPAAPWGLKLVTYDDYKINDQVNLRAWAYGRQDSKDDVETPFDHGVTDPDGFEDSWTRAELYDDGGSPPATPADSPPAGMQLQTYDDQRLNDQKLRRVWRYGLDTSASRVVDGGQYSSRSSIEPFLRTSLEIVDSSSTPETLMDVYFPTFQTEQFAYRMTVRKLNPLKGVIVREYVNPGIGLLADTHGVDDFQTGRVSGGAVQVFVVDLKTRGSGSYVYRLGRSQKRRVAREFTLSRLLSGTTVPDFQSIVENTNNATFLGLSAGSVMYLSSRVRSNIDLTGTYTFYMDYRFLWLSGGHYSIDGWRWQIRSSASVAAGWVNLTSLTGSGLAAAIPPQSDFSGFLA